VNILVGLFVHRLNAHWALQISYFASALSPLLLAVMRKGASYWEFEFLAVALVPIAVDVLYTLSQLIITAEFREDEQALAGGVFNTVAQIGKSVGLAVTAVVASSTSARVDPKVSHDDRTLVGYRAAWWYAFASTIVPMIVTFWGLRKIGKVGLKKE
jgi:predicted MFS family arabinose efflux permease